MAAIGRIALILITSLSVISIAIYCINDKREINNPTMIQQRILEVAHTYIPGFNCGTEDQFNGHTGIINWMGTLSLRVWKFITGSPPDNQLYVCELDWKVVSFQFSVKANGMVELESWMPCDNNWMIAVYVMLAVVALLAFPPLVYYLAGYYPEYMGYEELGITKTMSSGDRKKVSCDTIQQIKALEFQDGEKSLKKSKAVLAK